MIIFTVIGICVAALFAIVAAVCIFQHAVYKAVEDDLIGLRCRVHDLEEKTKKRTRRVVDPNEEK